MGKPGFQILPFFVLFLVPSLALNGQPLHGTPAKYLASSPNIPVTIATTVNYVATSKITVPSVSYGNFITDVQVIKVQGSHSLLSDIIFSLKSPKGTTVQLLSKQCANNAAFDTCFADNNNLLASQRPCPYNDGGCYTSLNPLRGFNGESSVGDWILTITDTVANNGGTLTNWGLIITTTSCSLNCGIHGTCAKNTNDGTDYCLCPDMYIGPTCAFARLPLHLVNVGERHACGVTELGNVHCQGLDPDAIVVVLPNSYNNGDIVQVAGQSQETLMLKSNGQVIGWSLSDPVGAITGILSDVQYDFVQIESFSDYYACGLRSTGQIACWGIGLVADTYSIQNADPDELNSRVQISGGADTLCSLYAEGLVDCVGITGPDSSLRFISIAASANYACGVTTAMGVNCWGAGGTEMTGPNFSGLNNVVQVGVSNEVTCVLQTTGTIQCWGQDSDALGVSLVDTPMPTTPVQMILGNWMACILFIDGNIQCYWTEADNVGGTDYRDLDNNDIFGTYGPIIDIAHTFGTTFPNGALQSCLIRKSGKLECWGSEAAYELSGPNGDYNYYKAAGVSNSATCGLISSTSRINCFSGSLWASQVNANTATYSSFSFTYYGICGITTTGILNCFGLTGVPVSGTGGFKAIHLYRDSDYTSSFYRACAIKTNNQVVCWSTNDVLATTKAVSTGLNGTLNARQVITQRTKGCVLLLSGQITCVESQPTTGLQTDNLQNFIYFDLFNEGYMCGVRRDGTITCTMGNAGGPPQGVGYTKVSGDCALYNNEAICWNDVVTYPYHSYLWRRHVYQITYAVAPANNLYYDTKFCGIRGFDPCNNLKNAVMKSPRILAYYVLSGNFNVATYIYDAISNTSQLQTYEVLKITSNNNSIVSLNEFHHRAGAYANLTCALTPCLTVAYAYNFYMAGISFPSGSNSPVLNLVNIISGFSKTIVNSVFTGQFMKAQGSWFTVTNTMWSSSPNYLNNGGAVSLVGCPYVWFDNCQFLNNQGQNGGALYAQLSYVYCSNCQFTGNRGQNGGAIYAAESTILLTNASITSNAGGLSNYYWGNGGGICLSVSSLYLTSSTCSNNSNLNGGCIFSSSSSAIQITQSNISNNAAVSPSVSSSTKGFGGGIYLENGQTTYSITNSRVSNNSATQGGGMYASGSPGSIMTNSIFSWNQAQDGGAISAVNSDITLSGNPSFINNSLIYVLSTNTLPLTGGAISCHSSSLNKLQISQSTFSYNSALLSSINWPNTKPTNATNSFSIVEGGGALNIDGCVLTITTTTNFNNNQAFYGGAIFLKDRDANPLLLHSIANTFFTSNLAYDGGAIFSWGIDSLVKTPPKRVISKSNFTTNSATFSGGGIFFFDSQWTVNTSNFSKNIIQQGGGGAMYCEVITPIPDTITLNTIQIPNGIGGYSPSIGSIGTHVNITGPTSCLNGICASGQPIIGLQVAVSDISNNTVKSANTSSIILSLPSATLKRNVTLTGPTIKPVSMGISQFWDPVDTSSISNLGILAKGTNGTDPPYTIQVDYTFTLFNGTTTSVPSSSFTLTVAHCQPGNKFDILTQQCQSCPPGQYSTTVDAPSCTLCSSGSYSSKSSSTTCDVCSAGYICSDGSTSPTQIACGSSSVYCTSNSTRGILVQDGYYSTPTTVAENIRTGELACEIGYYCQYGELIPCGIGTYSKIRGNVVCTACGAGYYTDKNQSADCTACLEGYWCAVGSTSPTQNPCATPSVYCPTNSSQSSIVSDGYYSEPETLGSVRTKQTQCQPGYYCLYGQRNACPTGTFSDTNGSMACTPCAAGSYANTSQNTACLPCDEGYWCASGSSSPTQNPCDASSVYCPSNSSQSHAVSDGYETEPETTGAVRTKQTECGAGYYCQYGVRKICPAGTHSNTSGSSLCNACDAGFYTNTTQTVDCASCEEGYYCQRGERFACPAGTFSNKSESTTCQNCDRGKYTDQQQSITCLPCAEGYWCGAGSSSAHQYPCTTSSIYCPAGSSISTLVTDGYYTATNADNVRINQTICEVGYYCQYGEKNECTEGTYSKIAGSTTCNFCDPGYYTDKNKSTICLPCTKGYWCAKGSPSPTQNPCNTTIAYCPQNSSNSLLVSDGYYSTPTTGVKDNQAPCLPGFFCQYGISTECGEGSFSENNASTKCSSCPKGYYAPSGNTQCLVCELGYYSNTEGAATCLQCPPSTFGNETGLEACYACPNGTVSKVGSSKCTSCSMGRYTEDQLQCLNCTLGQYQDQEGSTKCKICSPGYYASVYAANTCLACEPGKYTPFSQSPGCTDAYPGQYVAGTAALQPDNCTNGTFSNTTGVSSCYTCPPPQFQRNDKSTGCSQCDKNFYPLFIGDIYQNSCIPCLDGMVCSGKDWPQPAVGAYVTSVNRTGQFQVFDCPACTNGSCGAHRLPYLINPLCAHCDLGYYEWGGECSSCDKGYGGFLFLLFLGSWLYVMFVHFSSQSIASTGGLKILLFFVSTVRILLQGKYPWLTWLHFFDFDPSASGSSRCIAPFDAYQQFGFQIALPFIMLVELMVSFMIYRCMKYNIRQDQEEQPQQQDEHNINTPPQEKSWSRFFGLSAFYRTLLSLGIFSYTQITNVVFQYLHCIQVGNNYLVASSPTIDCHSDRYISNMPWIIVFLIFPVAGFPILIAGILWKYRDHLFISVQDHGKEVAYRLAPEGRRFGTVYETYNQRRYWWEPVALLRRTLLIAVSISTNTPIFLAEGYLFVTVFMLMMQVWAHPYCLPLDNQLEQFTLFFLVLIAILQTSVINGSSETAAIQAFMTIFILVPIICIAIYLVLLEYRALRNPLSVVKEAGESRKAEEPSGDVPLQAPDDIMGSPSVQAIESPSPQNDAPGLERNRNESVVNQEIVGEVEVESDDESHRGGGVELSPLNFNPVGSSASQLVEDDRQGTTDGAV